MSIVLSLCVTFNIFREWCPKTNYFHFHLIFSRKLLTHFQWYITYFLEIFLKNFSNLIFCMIFIELL